MRPKELGLLPFVAAAFAGHHWKRIFGQALTRLLTRSAGFSDTDCSTRSGHFPAQKFVALPATLTTGSIVLPLVDFGLHRMNSLAPVVHRQLGPASARQVAHPSLHLHLHLVVPFAFQALFLGVEEARSRLASPGHPHRASPKCHVTIRRSPCAVASGPHSCL